MPKINLPDNYENGQKGAIIEMFGWPYDQIEKECEFVGKAGYLGVKVFPPQEAILSYTTVENGELNPGNKVQEILALDQYLLVRCMLGLFL